MNHQTTCKNLIEEISPESIGKTIKFIRTYKGITQKKFAEEVGISVSYVSLLEKGKKSVSSTTLMRIAQVFHIPLFLLVFSATDPRVQEKFPTELRRQLSLLVFTSLNEQELK